MIDYDKLKLAFNTAHILSEQESYVRIEFITVFQNDDWRLEFTAEFPSLGTKPVLSFDNIDDLIAKLESLTQPKAKYEYGDTVWVDWCNAPLENFITGVITYSDSYQYYLSETEDCYNEDQLHPTKSALIDHMIEHWKSMRGNTAYGMHTAMDTLSGNGMREPIATCRDDIKVSATNNYGVPFEGEIKGFDKTECKHPRYPHGLTNHIRRKCPQCNEYAYFAEDKS